MNQLRNLFRKAADSYLVIFCTAIVIGLLLSGVFSPLAPYLTWMLATIFFFNSMRIDVKDVIHDLHEWKLILAGVLWMLIGLAVVSWYFILPIWPDMALPFLLLAAMPAGTTLPLLVEIIGGRPSLALIFTVVSSILAPFTIPLVIRLLAHEVVQVDAWSMFRNLFIIIVVPFFLAQALRHFRKDTVLRFKRSIKGTVVLLLALIIATVVAQQTVNASGADSHLILPSLAAITLLFAFFAVSGWFLAWGRPAKDKLTMSMSVTNSNFILAIFLASKYFPEPKTAIPVIMAVLPWTLFIIPFRIVAAKIEAKRLPWWRRLLPKKLS